MAGFSAEVEVHGLDDALRVARRLTNLGEHPAPLLGIAGAVLEASTLRRFDEEKGPGGVPWPKSRRAGGFSVGRRGPRQPRAGLGKTLTDTGDLRDSIRYEVRDNEVEIGSDGLKNPVKALANQFGSHRQTVVVRHTRTINSAFGVPLPKPVTVTVRGHGRITNLPARPFIGIDDEDRRDLGEAWNDYLVSLFDGI